MIDNDHPASSALALNYSNSVVYLNFTNARNVCNPAIPCKSHIRTSLPQIQNYVSAPTFALYVFTKVSLYMRVYAGAGAHELHLVRSLISWSYLAVVKE